MVGSLKKAEKKKNISKPKAKKLKKSLVNILDNLVERTEINATSLISDDGLVIANNSHQDAQEKQISTSFAGLSASILSMAERGIEIINADITLGQIEIDTGTGSETTEPIRIILRRVFPNVLLLIMAPKSVSRGLIHYETRETIKDVKTVVKEGGSKELFESIGSLTL